MDFIGVEIFAIGGQVPGAFGIEEAEILGASDSVVRLRSVTGSDSSAGCFCQMEQGFLIECCFQKANPSRRAGRKAVLGKLIRRFRRKAANCGSSKAPVLSIREIQSGGDEAAFHGRRSHVDEFAVMDAR